MPEDPSTNEPQLPGPIEIHAASSFHHKRRGEAAEAAFLAKVCAFDFPVAKPWGECRPYDFLVGSGYGFLRVQVKFAGVRTRGWYQIKGSGGGAPYTKQDIDFLATYIAPENLWYVLPVEAFSPRPMLKLYPHGRGKSKYEKYREAWCLLVCSPKARGRKDIPALCRSRELSVRCAVCPLRR
jgi:PD-(D/E)XK endonuclease